MTPEPRSGFQEPEAATRPPQAPKPARVASQVAIDTETFPAEAFWGPPFLPPALGDFNLVAFGCCCVTNRPEMAHFLLVGDTAGTKLGVTGSCGTVGTGSDVPEIVGVPGVVTPWGWGQMSPGAVTPWGWGQVSPGAVAPQGRGQVSPGAVTPQRGRGWGQCRVWDGVGDTREGLGTRPPLSPPGPCDPRAPTMSPCSVPAGEEGAASIAPAPRSRAINDQLMIN